MLAIHFNDRGTVAKLEQLHGQARNPRQMMMACGREVANQLKQHFQIRDRNQSNKLGGKREHFWLQVAGSVQSPVVNSSGLRVSVAINDPRLPQKVFGGTIRSKNGTMLTIPQTPEAYGRTAKTFERETGMVLFLVKTKSGAGLAVAAANGGITVEYVLTPAVIDQPKDPDALPRTELLQAAVEKRADEVVTRQIRDAGMA